MFQRIAPVAMALTLIAGLSNSVRAFPEPSPFPVSWELKLDYKTPRRVVVEVPGSALPKAFWYMTYTVTNKTDQEQEFLPLFEMVTKSGKVIRSDKNISKAVFDRIKVQVGNKLLESPLTIGGKLRVGEDQAKDGVAIWEEAEPEMGSFTIFATGLSGETAAVNGSDGKPLTDKDGKPLILFKTLQLDYNVAGDEVTPGNDPITKTAQKWVMR